MTNAKLKSYYPLMLDWGSATVEGYDQKKAEAVLIFNFDLTSEQKLGNAAQYVFGRVCWGVINMPENSSIRLIFDLRGQDIPNSQSKNLEDYLLSKFKSLQVFNNIIFEFVR